MTPVTGIATAIVGLGFTILVFRIKRELDMAEKGERTWIAFSDWLVVVAIVVAGLFVLIPLLAGDGTNQSRLLTGAVCFAIVMTLGWIPAILAHYRLIFGGRRHGPRSNPEPAEAIIVLVVFFLSAATFVATYLWPKWRVR